MNKHIIIILSILCLCGCNRLVEYDYTTILILKNNSSHTIAIKGNSDIYKMDCSINSGESYSGIESEDMPLPVGFLFGGRCIVTFDDKIEVEHSTTTERSLCNENSYSVKVSGRHDTETTYTYVFTDEDYERAVAANAESGE